MRFIRSWAFFLSAAGLALLISACSGPSRATVSGKVTFEGQPIAASGVMISFIGTDGKPVTAEVGADGKYQASGVLVGEVQVAVAYVRPQGQDLPSLLKPKDRFDPKTEAPKLDPALMQPMTKSPFPESYSDPTTSNLKTTIEKGENIYNADLKKR